MQTELGVICEPQIYKAQIIESYLLPEKRRVLFCLFVLFILERGREGEREGEKHRCVKEALINCLSQTPSRAPGPQPSHVPWLGIEPATLWFTVWRLIHWATPAKAKGLLNGQWHGKYWLCSFLSYRGDGFLFSKHSWGSLSLEEVIISLRRLTILTAGGNTRVGATQDTWWKRSIKQTLRQEILQML